MANTWQSVALQFGHGTEPWRNMRQNNRSHRDRFPSIRPRHGAVEKPPATPARCAGSNSFNSATARSRGETSQTARSGLPKPRSLQFGHGTEPWRNAVLHFDVAQQHFLQFGHGTEPWRNNPEFWLEVSLTHLQFGHGTEPWRNPASSSPSPRHGRRTFNSATARSRGETKHKGRSTSGDRTFNSATARSRGETEADGRDSDDGRPSIRPRHGAVEKRRVTGAIHAGSRRLQFGHGTEPWRNDPAASGLCAGPGTFNSATARSRGETSVTSGTWRTGDSSFNSATARSRGETWPRSKRSARKAPSIRPRHGAVEKLAGTLEPIRANVPSIRPRHGAVEKLHRADGAQEVTRSAILQFGHGTEPWRNVGKDYIETTTASGLQFGHGTEPWRNHQSRDW